MTRHILPANWTNRGMVVNIDMDTFDFPWPHQMFKGLQIRYIFVANRMAGYVAYDFPTSQIREIKRIAIRPEFQHIGCGTDLLHYIRSEARTEKNTHLTAFVDERKLTALKFFARFGFKSKLTRGDDGIDYVRFHYVVK